MLIYGFAKDFQYTNDGTYKIKVRIPAIHGPYRQTVECKTYTKDEDLPWYTSVLLPVSPKEGDVVMLSSVSESKSSQLVVIGLTGGNYRLGVTLITD